MNKSDNSRIVSNTFFLYLRMIVIMLVRLYTTRIVLSALGVDDFGTWSVIAAFVVTFTTISSPLVASIQRFLNYDMGQGGKKLNAIFCVGVELFLFIALLMFLILESFGLWFVNSRMNFEPEKIQTVNLIFQFAIVSFVFQLIQKPFEAVIVAFERMSFFAVLSVIEAFCWLGIAFMIKFGGFSNPLVVYSFMTMLVSIIIFSSYKVYSNLSFPCSRFRFKKDVDLIKEMGRFSGWNILGSISTVTSNEGVNILINIFYGVAVNAAYGLTQQVKNAVMMVTANIQKAFEPQITRNYSSGDSRRVNTLSFTAVKLSYLLSFLLIFPIMLNLRLILAIWLGNDVPDYAYLFIMLTLAQTLLLSFDGTIDSVVFSSGRIRGYILWLGGENLLNIIFTYLLFKNHIGPVSAFVVRIFVEVGGQIIRFYFFKTRLNLDYITLIKCVFIPILLVSMFPVVVTLFFLGCWSEVEGWQRFGISTVYLPITLICAYEFILTSSQRERMKVLLKSKMMKRMA